jgi:hypothetical protein
MARNDPCPCGSGKKYKKCCGALSALSGRSSLVINKATAYKGGIGRLRERFCIHYVEHKKRAIELIEKSLREEAAANNESITCSKGCHECCFLYVIASLQECEAIVYWLYQRRDILLDFLRNYQLWGESVMKIEDVFNTIVELSDQVRQLPEGDEAQLRFKSAIHQYRLQKIPCPFLAGDSCFIYEVRPWGCAGLISTSPREWCDPSHPNSAEVKCYKAENYYSAELPFYLSTKVDINLGCMPQMVCRILEGGYGGMSQIPGLENLQEVVSLDPEVQETLRRLYEVQR